VLKHYPLRPGTLSDTPETSAAWATGAPRFRLGAAVAVLSRCYIRAVSHVLVLNASYEPLNVCSTRRAHVLVWKGKAEVVERLDEPLRTATNTYTRPHVIRLVTYVRVPRSVKRRISRRALFARDGWRCVYCGDSATRLTLDHVVPRSRGGDSVWENVVTACAPCNLRKGDRLLEETHMNLARPPRAPSPVLFISLALHRVPDAWLRYLPAIEHTRGGVAAEAA
jgi:5-methylcytosine-specific restriction endonuclease McrA